MFKNPFESLSPAEDWPVLSSLQSTEALPLFRDTLESPFDVTKPMLSEIDAPLASDICAGSLSAITASAPAALNSILLRSIEPMAFGSAALNGPLEHLMSPANFSAFDAASLSSTERLLTADVFQTTLDSIPLQIEFSPCNLASAALNPVHLRAAAIEDASWLTSPIDVANRCDSLVDILEASRLTKLTNDFVLAGLKPMARTPLAVLSDLESTSKSYADFIRAAESSVFDPTLFAIPARGYFASGDTFLQFQPGQRISAPLQQRRESARADLERRTESELGSLLNEIDPQLYKLWRGAHMAAASSNPDRIRHACVSVRELMTQVLHTLAPDAEILKWTSDPSQFYNGKPTRETRLRYICQPVAMGAFSDYIGTEIKSVVALGNIFQKGTHGIGVELSPLQLRLIFRRIEGTLCSLIEISDTSA